MDDNTMAIVAIAVISLCSLFAHWKILNFILAMIVGTSVAIVLIFVIDYVSLGYVKASSVDAIPSAFGVYLFVSFLIGLFFLIPRKMKQAEKKEAGK